MSHTKHQPYTLQDAIDFILWKHPEIEEKISSMQISIETLKYAVFLYPDLESNCALMETLN